MPKLLIDIIIFIMRDFCTKDILSSPNAFIGDPVTLYMLKAAGFPIKAFGNDAVF